MLRWMLIAAGAGQLAFALASLAIPRVLGWREETAKLKPLTRHVFWTYATYIFCAHLAFGLLSLLAPASLMDGSPLSAAVTGFIALWWGARLVLQFSGLDRSARPPGMIYVLLEIALVSGFVCFAGVYAYAAWRNLAA